MFHVIYWIFYWHFPKKTLWYSRTRHSEDTDLVYDIERDPKLCQPDYCYYTLGSL